MTNLYDCCSMETGIISTPEMFKLIKIMDKIERCNVEREFIFGRMLSGLIEAHSILGNSYIS